jgi:serine/threonine protein kinase
MGHVPPGELCRTGSLIADALAAAHDCGVLHRDVKPANILTTRFQSPVLADFGLAVLLDQRDGREALDSLTPAYAPPESVQLAGASPAGDVYSLAATLYALSAGHPPRLPGAGVPTAAALAELYQLPVPDLPGVPAALLEALRSALANDPAARPSAAEFRDMLAELCDVRPGDVRPGTVPEQR